MARCASGATTPCAGSSGWRPPGRRCWCRRRAVQGCGRQCTTGAQATLPCLQQAGAALVSAPVDGWAVAAGWLQLGPGGCEGRARPFSGCTRIGGQPLLPASLCYILHAKSSETCRIIDVTHCACWLAPLTSHSHFLLCFIYCRVCLHVGPRAGELHCTAQPARLPSSSSRQQQRCSSSSGSGGSRRRGGAHSHFGQQPAAVCGRCHRHRCGRLESA